MRIAIALGALVVATGLVVLLILSRNVPQPPTVVRSLDPATVQDAHISMPPPPAVQDAPVVRTPDDSPQLQAVRSSGIADEPWSVDAAALVAKLAPDATTTCYVAGCIVEHAEQAQSAFAADTTWTGGKQWIGATLILYRPD